MIPLEMPVRGEGSAPRGQWRQGLNLEVSILFCQKDSPTNQYGRI